MEDMDSMSDQESENRTIVEEQNIPVEDIPR